MTGPDPPQDSQAPDDDDLATLMRRLKDMLGQSRDGADMPSSAAANGNRGPAEDLPKIFSPKSRQTPAPPAISSLRKRLDEMQREDTVPQEAIQPDTRTNGMRPVEAGQCWIYRVPKGFEHSRIIIGATLDTQDGRRIICGSVVDAPWRMHASQFETITIPFLPMTETAFQATVVDLEGYRTPPSAFAEKFEAWKNDPRGISAFTVPFDGFLDQMIELQKLWKKGATRNPDPRTARILNAIKALLHGGLITERHPIPKGKQEFEAVLAQLRRLSPHDLEGKLVVGGFQPHPSADQRRCFECTYFLPHSSICDLPELSIPVEPYWSCRLWSI